MKTVVVGCGRLGAELAYRLFKRGHQVTVVDESPQQFSRLPADFLGRSIYGDLLSAELMESADFTHANCLAAVTDNDSINAVVAHVARTVYHIPNVVVRSYDPALRPVLATFGFQIVSSSSWGAQRIEEILHSPRISTVFSAGNGEVEVYEMVIPEQWEGRLLKSLVENNAECLVVALTRNGHAILPAPDILLRAGDILDISATDSGIACLHGLLEVGKES